MYDTSFQWLLQACHADPLRCTPLQVIFEDTCPTYSEFFEDPEFFANQFGNPPHVVSWVTHYHFPSSLCIPQYLGSSRSPSKSVGRLFQSWSIGASPPAPLTLRWRGNHSPGGGVLEWDHRLLCLKHLNKRRASSLILWIPLSFSFSIICRGPRLHSSVRGQQSFYAWRICTLI